MKVLVTGEQGFVGRYLVKHLKDSGDDVVGFGAHDIRDREKVEEIVLRLRPEVIYHLAGVSFVPDAEKNFKDALDVNVLGTEHLISACKSLSHPPTFVLASSGEVYGKIKSIPISEDTPAKPANNYSLSKLFAEEVVRKRSRDGIVRGVILRLFNHIGPGQREDFVVANFTAQLKSGKKELKVGNLSAKRDFSDVRDVVKAYRLAAEQGSGTYNIGSGESYSIQEILDKLIQISGAEVEIVQDPARMRGPEVPEIKADITKAKRDLGWNPEFSIDETLGFIWSGD